MNVIITYFCNGQRRYGYGGTATECWKPCITQILRKYYCTRYCGVHRSFRGGHVGTAFPSLNCLRTHYERHCKPFYRRKCSQIAGFYIYRVAQKVSHHQFFKKSYKRLPTRLHFFVKLKHESSTIIQSVANKYSAYDLLL